MNQMTEEERDEILATCRIKSPNKKNATFTLDAKLYDEFKGKCEGASVSAVVNELTKGFVNDFRTTV